MRVNEMLRELQKTRAHWIRAARSLDIVGNTRTYTKAVSDGLGIAVKIVLKHQEHRKEAK